MAKSAKENVLNVTALQTAHVGISIFEPATRKYWFNYQGDHYFVPASNMKIPTCYAAMKYLGDSLVGLRMIENDTAIILLPAADPTLLHPDYIRQPAIEFLKQAKKKIYVADNFWETDAIGSGWSWNDYNDDYMAERSALPVYGNLIKWIQERNGENEPAFIYSVPEVNWGTNFSTDTTAGEFYVKRNIGANIFNLTQGKEKLAQQSVPFITNGISSALELLPDTIHQTLSVLTFIKAKSPLSQAKLFIKTIHSQPTDSVLQPMMHRSDNFFAEQTLLMVSNERLGVMNDEKIIDTLLKTDFKDLPQKPRWVDGSGLSRYNLFSPQDFVFILNKMKEEFGMERIKIILPTGNNGTLENYYKADSNYIFAKTGTLSGVVSLSGYLYTKKNKLLIFSVLVNNHQASAKDIRRAIEKFIQSIRDRY